MRDMRTGKATAVTRSETFRGDAFALLGYRFLFGAVIVVGLAMHGLAAPYERSSQSHEVPAAIWCRSMMTRREANIGLIASAALVAAGELASAQAAVDLPPPRSQDGKPLIEALRLRRSIRKYSNRTLPTQVLSDLLWAAFGINRLDSGDRTAALST